MAEAVWGAKAKIPVALAPALVGYHASKSKFREAAIKARKGPRRTPPDQASLIKRAATAYNETASEVDRIDQLSTDDLLTVTQQRVWAQSIRGASDVSVAELIESLHNTDWVREGRTFLNHSDGTCPFCQQAVPDNLVAQLDAYFGATYTAQLSVLEQAADQMDIVLDELEIALPVPLTKGSTFLNEDLYAAESATVRSVIAECRRVARLKRDSPADAVAFPDVSDTLDALNDQISKADQAIDAHNLVIANKAASVAKLTSDVWSWLVWDELDAVLTLYVSAEAKLQAAIKGLSTAVETHTRRIAEIDERLEVLAHSTRSSRPAIAAINRMLVGAGFTSFRLDSARELKDGYRIIREDGTLVLGNLSEGEQSFISFLYFLHEIRGIDPATGQAPGLIVVIDDPISSLDSSSLFFVSSKTRELIHEALDGSKQIKQLILLTHNVYFHKEVAYGHQKWPNAGRLSFHVIEKREASANVITTTATNPISTTYALLWAEVHDAQAAGRITTATQNSMRRILESFFGFTGGKAVNDLPSSFEGDEKVLCRSLISWIHDGSHSTNVLDSLHYSPAIDSATAWFKMFEEIFKRTDHGDHHKMMMSSLSATHEQNTAS